MNFKEFLLKAASYGMLFVIMIALIGATTSEDVFFQVTGILGIIADAILLVRTFKARDPRGLFNKLDN